MAATAASRPDPLNGDSNHPTPLAQETEIPCPLRYTRLPTLYQAHIGRKTRSVMFSRCALATDRYEGDLTASDEGTPRWIRLDKVLAAATR